MKNETDVIELEKSLLSAMKEESRKNKGPLYDIYLRNNISFSPQEEREIKDRAEKIKLTSRKIFEIPDYILETTPGLVGEIANWITETAKAPQPALSLGAALVSMGVMKGHRVRSKTDIRTNLFCLGIADAGSGKDHTLEMTEKLLEQSGHERLVCSPPTAGSSIAPLLKERDGRAYIIWDEIGHSIEYSLNKRAASYEKSIISELLSVYSRASSSYRSKEYTNKKMNETIVVNQPCLGIWGVTTPAKFYDVITSANASDGFLPRWLMFPITDPDSENREVKLCDDVPKEIVNELVSILKMKTNSNPESDIDLRIRPKVIELSPEAEKFEADIRDAINIEKRKEREKGTGLDVIWSRAWVNVVKCALIVSDGDQIGETELIWAYSLVTEILKGSCRAFIENTFETESGKEIDRVLKCITKRPGITLSQVLRSSHLKAKDLWPILTTLLERGDVKMIEDLGPFSKTTKRFYRVLD